MIETFNKLRIFSYLSKENLLNTYKIFRDQTSIAIRKIGKILKNCSTPLYKRMEFFNKQKINFRKFFKF